MVVMKRALIALVLVTATAGTAGTARSQERVCTLIGCSSGVTVRITAPQPAGSTFTVCIDDHCAKRMAQGDFYRLEDSAIDGSKPVRIRIVLRSKRRRVLARYDQQVMLTKSQPNGPECEPICWQATFAIGAGRSITRES
jgi:hypothetical protein